MTMDAKKMEIASRVWNRISTMPLADQGELLSAAICRTLGHCHRGRWPAHKQDVYEDLTELMR